MSVLVMTQFNDLNMFYQENWTSLFQVLYKCFRQIYNDFELYTMLYKCVPWFKIVYVLWNNVPFIRTGYRTLEW